MPNWKKLIVSGSDANLSSLNIDGNLTASAAYLTSASIGHLQTIYETASVIYSSGSTKFGDTLDDTHEITGSLLVTGSITGNLTGTASLATTSSHALTSVSSSFTSTGDGVFSGSFSGSFTGDGAGLTGLNISVVGYSNEITLSSDYTTTNYSYNSLHGPLNISEGITVTVSTGSFLKVEEF